MFLLLGDDGGFCYETFRTQVWNLTIPRFTGCGWCVSYARYWSVCVGFLNTPALRLQTDFLVTTVLRKTRLLLLSVSMVKRMEGFWGFKCFKKLSTLSKAKMVKVSSTYYFQIMGWLGDALLLDR